MTKYDPAKVREIMDSFYFLEPIEQFRCAALVSYACAAVPNGTGAALARRIMWELSVKEQEAVVFRFVDSVGEYMKEHAWDLHDKAEGRGKYADSDGNKATS